MVSVYPDRRRHLCNTMLALPDYISGSREAHEQILADPSVVSGWRRYNIPAQSRRGDALAIEGC